MREREITPDYWLGKKEIRYSCRWADLIYNIVKKWEC